MNLWRSISYIGVTAEKSASEKRTILLSNRVSFIVSLFTFITSVVSYLFFGGINSTYLGFGASIFFLLPLITNVFGFTKASRILLGLMMSVVSLVISVIDKFDYIIIEEMQYFEFRLTLLSATIFPFILFDLKERSLWLFALTINFLCIVLFDPAHEAFGVGYYQIGFTGPNYYFINYITIAAFIFISSSTYFLKFSFEKSEIENVQLISQLSEKQDELLKANTTIENQRKQLTIENQQLNNDLISTNKKLTETNNELITHNNNLQQFSYTISHNLRGPVASLRGLLNLINEKELGVSNAELLEHFSSSVLALDGTIRDLNHIIELRNDVSGIRDTVNLDQLVSQIKSLLQKEISEQEVTITQEFEIGEFQSLKAMVQSILFNLISNAIKYRSYERNLIINLRSKYIGNNRIQIDVQDNGVGIDLALYKEKIFGLYKRFHTHTEGKGLGLFLVKLQAETLGGSVSVSSKQGVGSTFSVVVEV